MGGVLVVFPGLMKGYIPGSRAIPQPIRSCCLGGGSGRFIRKTLPPGLVFAIKHIVSSLQSESHSVSSAGALPSAVIPSRFPLYMADHGFRLPST